MERRLFNEISQFALTYKDVDDVWFIGNQYSLIFQMSMKDCSIKKVVRIKDEEFIQFRHYWKLIRVQSKIVLIPVNSDKIVFFHVDKDEFSFIRLPKSTCNCLNCVREGNLLYLVSDPEIIVLDIEHEKVVKYIPIPQYGNILSEVTFLIDGHIIIPLIFQDGIIDFQISKMAFSYIRLNCGANGYITGVQDGKNIWLAGENGNIIRWDYTGGKYTLYDQLPEDFESFNYEENGAFVTWGKGWRPGICFKYWYDCFMIDDKVWFFPLLSNSLLYIDKRSNTIQKYTFLNEKETESTAKSHQTQKFIFVGIQQNRYIKVYSVKREIIYSIDITTLNYTEEIINIDKVDMTEIEKEYRDVLYDQSVKEGISEGRNISINELVKIVERGEEYAAADVLNRQIGIEIYKRIHEEL